MSEQEEEYNYDDFLAHLEACVWCETITEIEEEEGWEVEVECDECGCVIVYDEYDDEVYQYWDDY